ncbi:hypothetical protein [Methylophilus sp. Leaf408]|uniref:hypothetical protein n=1 Tax=Methylophilus sp. Leaf408 TaxID=2876561 RepID=UPI001E602DAA|nr:hypothetical protein [Methylophilus sp. Leaf408]
MTSASLLKTTIVASMLAVSSMAIAADSTFQSEFVNKTLLGNWKPQTVSSNDQVKSVDASKDRFMDNILGRFKIITPATKVANLKIDDSLKRYTEQFEHTN